MSRRILTFSLFEAARTAGLTQEQEEFLNKCTKGIWKYDPATGLVDVVGDFDCSRQYLQDMKGIRFGQVGGGFYCGYNQLITLEGAPQKVGGYFSCRNNQLTSLKGAPQEVGGRFYCGGNKLTTLEGAPQKLGSDFICDAFSLEKDEWNPKGWLKVLKKGKMEAQQLILPLLSHEVLNQEIQKDPAGMIMKLKSVWNDGSFKETRDKLVWPRGYEKEADLLGDLDDVGF